jgi:hypothetical protein
MRKSDIKWVEIKDFRDDCFGCFEIENQEDIENEIGELSLSDLPETDYNVYQTGRRWICQRYN